MTTRDSLVGQIQRPGQRPEHVEIIVKQRPVLTQAELAAGLKWVDGRYLPGDVRRYGAIGDDSTDDTKAIQAAFDSVVADGGIVFFPPGVYKITDSITSGPIDNKKTDVIGYGATIKQYTSAENGLNVRNSRCYIYGLRFETDSDVTASNAFNCIDILNVSHVSITDCVFNQPAIRGIAIRTDDTQTQDVTDISIKGCHFIECSGTSVAISGDTVGPNFARRVSIVGNSFTSPGSPVSNQTRAVHVVENAVDITIANNVTSGTGATDYSSGWRDCIQIGNSSSTSQPDNVVVSGNFLTGMGDDCVGISGATNVVVSGNTLYNSLVTSGVYVPGDGTWSNDNITVAGNVIYDCELAGIFLKDTLSYSITGNLIHDCHQGIYVNDNGSGILRGTISGNTIHTVEQIGIHWDGGFCSIVGNVIDGYGDSSSLLESDKAGIFIDESGSGSVVANNSMANGINGIVITGAPDGFVISGNVVQSTCTGDALHFISFTGDNMIIANNILLAATAAYQSAPAASSTIVYTGNVPAKT